ncbi:hypothetical protein AYO20_00180 [Fonsecaea nubica]|uniref:Uncharacterized protein n=1 Tax=Fonsecaea nubica TaxID=856822 RepID=A0A178DGJ2_9EURO|nr:hypothetical protein AYO20_00180 [Fonsecaea nubica]OAL40444.1 hypothetical protein AYO20_00180 [Fonsecaea nubica]
MTPSPPATSTTGLITLFYDLNRPRETPFLSRHYSSRSVTSYRDDIYPSLPCIALYIPELSVAIITCYHAQCLPLLGMRDFLPTIGPESKFLHDHYLHRTACALSAAQKGQSPFVNLLLPLASCSDLILQAVLSLSGVHFGEEDKSSQQAVVTYGHYAQALRGLKYGLTKFASGQTDLALELLLATLLLCFIEGIRGDTEGNSFHHLNAARQLFPVMLANTEQLVSCREMVLFVTEFYAYVLTLSSFTSKTSVVDDAQVIFNALSRLKTPMTGPFFGCARELFALIPSAAAAIRYLDHEPRTNEQTQQHDPSLTTNLRSRVLSWAPAPICRDDQVIAGRLYQLSILLLLNNTEEPGEIEGGDFPSSSEVLMSNFVDMLQNLNVGAEITTTLCWPLAVAGSYAYDVHHQQVIKQYLVEMEAHYAFKNLTLLRTLLQRCWQGRTEEDQANITSTMNKQGISVMFF